jgi:hypothetical protein
LAHHGALTRQAEQPSFDPIGFYNLEEAAMADRLTKGNLYRTLIGATFAMVIGTIALFTFAHHWATGA